MSKMHDGLGASYPTNLNPMRQPQIDFLAPESIPFLEKKVDRFSCETEQKLNFLHMRVLPQSNEQLPLLKKLTVRTGFRC